MHGGGGAAALKNVDILLVCIKGVQHVLPGQMDEEHTHVLSINLIQRGGDWSIKQNPHGGNKSCLHSQLVWLGHGAVEGEEDSQDVPQLGVGLSHGVVPEGERNQELELTSKDNLPDKEQV